MYSQYCGTRHYLVTDSGRSINEGQYIHQLFIFFSRVRVTFWIIFIFICRVAICSINRLQITCALLHPYSMHLCCIWRPYDVVVQYISGELNVYGSSLHVALSVSGWNLMREEFIWQVVDLYMLQFEELSLQESCLASQKDASPRTL